MTTTTVEQREPHQRRRETPTRAQIHAAQLLVEHAERGYITVTAEIRALAKATPVD